MQNMNGESHLRLLGYRDEKEEKVIRVALVSEIVDSYNTVINPRGCISPLESVLVDYNHNRYSTGAYLKDAGYTNIEVPNGEGGTKTVEARVVDVHVPKYARMWDKSNKDKKPEEVQSLYESVLNGRIGWASIDFRPIEDEIESVYTKSGTLKREVYNKWRLNYLSLLDIKPGQDTSYFLDIRSANLYTRQMDKKVIVAKVKDTMELKGITGNVEDLVVKITEENHGIIYFKMNGSEYQVDYFENDQGIELSAVVQTQDPSGKEVVAQIADAVSAGNGEGTVKVMRADDAIVTGAVTTDGVEAVTNETDKETVSDEIDKTDEGEKTTPKEGDDTKRCSSVSAHMVPSGTVLKDREGRLAIVKKSVMLDVDEGASGGQVCFLTVYNLETKETVEIKSELVGDYDFNEDDMGAMYALASQGDIVVSMFKLLELVSEKVNTRSAEERSDVDAEQLAELTKQIEEKDSLIRKLSNAPVVNKSGPVVAVMDNIQNAQATGKDKKQLDRMMALQQSKLRW